MWDLSYNIWNTTIKTGCPLFVYLIKGITEQVHDSLHSPTVTKLRTIFNIWTNGLKICDHFNPLQLLWLTYEMPNLAHLNLFGRDLNFTRYCFDCFNCLFIHSDIYYLLRALLASQHLPDFIWHHLPLTETSVKNFSVAMLAINYLILIFTNTSFLRDMFARYKIQEW